MTETGTQAADAPTAETLRDVREAIPRVVPHGRRACSCGMVLSRDFQYGPILPSVVALNGRITLSLSSFILSGTLREVMLATREPSAASRL